ncbi:alpha/beta fold hydrolase [Streptomyces sp. UNOC14_S4]|uniref:alpha/beta fold hydrolase n=1 Tax=Streptomyces sp. UNOC14_S4 TaxID=2872340 RepID=UPI001E2B2B42|nr:alpha/beta hydrolase [Streptomyces sp. UNOC14_S4]MCC3769436.1 alpha/beta hydrolase [Streptomyces sp. UNOC14_S4]
MSDSASISGTGVAQVARAAQAADEAVAGSGGWRRGAGVAGAAIGVVAAGAAVGVAVERLTVGRGMRRKARLALDSMGPYGTLRGRPGRAVAEDGTELYFEVDEVDGVGEAEGTGGAGGADGPGAAPAPSETSPTLLKRLFGRPAATQAPAPVTVVFTHGYCLSQDSWHFQRAALRGAVRMVFWDQRSHGRSERGRSQLDGSVPVSIDLLGRDLKAVIDAAAPEGPLVLVGHSMGGMTMMGLAAQYPELVAERVVGTAFVSTSSGELADNTYGLPVSGSVVRRVLPAALRALTAGRPELIERGRQATADLYAGVIRRYSFGSRDVDPAVARFAERLMEATPLGIIAEFYRVFGEHDKATALAEFAAHPVVVIAGEKDLMIPSAHSEAIAAALPEAELLLVPGAGHLVMFEHPELVTEHLLDLLDAATEGIPERAEGARRRG